MSPILLLIRAVTPAARLFALATIVVSALASRTAVAADDATKSIDYPLIVANVAGVERLQNNAKYMFELAERPDMVDVVEKWTIATLKEFKGIDRTRPFGVMFYLPATFGTPIGTVYIPITNLDDALQTIALQNGVITAVDGKKGYNDIRYGENLRFRTRQVGGYLFMVGPDADGDETFLDKNFPDPVKLTSRLSSQFDLAVSLQIKNVTPTMKQVFLEFLKISAQAELQQRDGEPDSAYRLRRANGDSWLELVDRIVTQGEELTIGARMNPETRKANIDFEIAGSSDSKLAKFFQDMAGKRTHFGNLLQNPSTFTLSASWLLSDKQRPLMANFFEAAKKDLTEAATKQNIEGVGKVTDPLFKAFMATSDAGHMDLVAQLVGTEPGQFALIAGFKVIGSRSLPNQMSDLMQFIKDHPNNSELIEKLEIGTSEIDSFPVHRLPINPPDRPGQRMFGESANLYFYTAPQALWFAFGGDTALDTLRDAVAQTALPQNPQQSRDRIPFMFVTHASNWLNVGEVEDEGKKRVRDSFKNDNDALHVLVRPTDSGVRVRAEFEEGFIALMGRGITRGIETGAFNGPQQRRRARQNDEDQPNPAPRQRQQP